MFQETSVGEISKFMSIYSGLLLEPKNNYYTFDLLKDAPTYSIVGGEFLGAPCTTTFQGEPWEVMRANGLVYDFNLGEVVPILSVMQRVDIVTGKNYFLSSGLILPGSVTDDGSRVTDYAAWLSLDEMKTRTFRYSEVTLE
jgi:hypothetical protein